jgi:DNA-binding SARP family transcriptional activator
LRFRPAAPLCRWDAEWPDGPPDTANNIIQGIVSKLRRSLGADVVTTAGSGYALNRSRADTDLDEVERLVAAGRTAMAAKPTEAAERFRRA